MRQAQLSSEYASTFVFALGITRKKKRWLLSSELLRTLLPPRHGSEILHVYAKELYFRTKGWYFAGSQGRRPGGVAFFELTGCRTA